MATCVQVYAPHFFCKGKVISLFFSLRHVAQVILHYDGIRIGSRR